MGGAPSPAAQSGGTFSKEGWFGGADGLHARINVKSVQRQVGKAVLRYSVTSLDSSTKSAPFEIALIDPVGRKLYKPTGTTSGSGFTPGATREMAAEYPPIPADVQKVTAITPGTAGEFTGIPVTDAASSGSPSASAPPSGSGMPTMPSRTPSGRPPARGEPSVGAEPFGRVRPFTAPTLSPSSSPSTSPSAGTGANPVDLYDIVEGETRDVTSGPSEVTVSLRADVLFDGASAKLSDRAKAVLDETAQQIKTKAAGALTFEGHTSEADTNLSKDRADAVMKEMKTRLGDGFTYTASGKGNTEPVAKDAARNNRVEISYQVKASARGTTSPAAFRPEDGKTVATRTASFGADKRRLDVKPFYRDGAYIVAVFDIVNQGPGTTPPDASYPDPNYPGGVFGSFSIQTPGGKDVYRAVRVGPANPSGTSIYVDPGRATFLTAVGKPDRGFVYLPAPSGSVTSVTFNAGPFGKIEKVPVS
ncbi:OmpA family protein [Actinomadura latina]|uniref:OmpA family protein n=1 Tax=Actinomadura latina TaxID=163603 RepID=A0A846YRU6_9ACTN|nr:OmpA family protein [Actinomadura latina]NKZ03550.1 OmpA family protein [Actinomadura latina]